MVSNQTRENDGSITSNTLVCPKCHRINNKFKMPYGHPKLHTWQCVRCEELLMTETVIRYRTAKWKKS